MGVISFLRRLFTGYVGDRTRPGWKESLPFYKGVCSIHGEYETYRQGYREDLPCPLCQDEKRLRRAHQEAEG